ncbi:antidote-toxin recognition MazE [Leptospira yanagawae serovar Saopaulo str. Sao Paulo = ATCC 700523]|uniref:Antidote-toxin recognition MazE n=2 Tax=Leptospira yanagawae TaxID=293069 RepID=A0A5E8HE22_9LEPT|nr:antidote-toxin recognition MazE [Leptospira yanagawae serovar Saopaulo str. Sao Paulo = ATCC 700523]
MGTNIQSQIFLIDERIACYYIVITMKVAVVQVGNSKGIRIPKAILAECQIEDAVELQLEGDKIIISPYKGRPRQGWATQFQEMAKQDDDSLLLPDVLELEVEDWEW